MSRVHQGEDALVQDVNVKPNIVQDGQCMPETLNVVFSDRVGKRFAEDKTKKPLYLGHEAKLALSLVMTLFNHKIINNWSDEVVDNLLRNLKKSSLPSFANLPNNINEMKMIVENFRSDYWDASKKNFMLFWRENDSKTFAACNAQVWETEIGLSDNPGEETMKIEEQNWENKNKPFVSHTIGTRPIPKTETDISKDEPVETHLNYDRQHLPEYVQSWLLKCEKKNDRRENLESFFRKSHICRNRSKPPVVSSDEEKMKSHMNGSILPDGSRIYRYDGFVGCATRTQAIIDMRRYMKQPVGGGEGSGGDGYNCEERSETLCMKSVG